MFDTMTIVKTVSALCGALLIFLLGSWFADAVYGGGGHGEGEHAAGYEIVVAEAGVAEAVVEVPFAEVLAAADAGKGERVFRKCTACHSVAAGENKTGPSLHAVVGRAVGSIDGFGYSGALDGTSETWTPEALEAFLKKPASYAPGTSMGFAGLPKVEDRADLIAYLSTLAD